MEATPSQLLLQLAIAHQLPILHVGAINGGGGDRQYFRLIGNNIQYIGTYSTNLAETETFLSFAHTLQQHHIQCPQLIAVSANKYYYIQQDLGDATLLQVLLAQGPTTYVYKLYQQALQQLVNIQCQAGPHFDYRLCLTQQFFDESMVLFDLNYWKQYYCDTVGVQIHDHKLQQEFTQLANTIGQLPNHYFMYRDFQGRNLMVQDDKVYCIDFQGAMQGPLGYDAASLLWQAKAHLPMAWRQQLLAYYYQLLQQQLGNTLPSYAIFEQNYYLILLSRLLQVLGAYGRRGLIEGKPHFVSSIPMAMQNIKAFLQLYPLGEQYPYLHQIMLLMLAKHDADAL
jgi:aminoglycoside/choline kinase family phosphotransferase